MTGASPLHVQKGLSESLTGHFEVIPVTHWSFSEMQAAFSWNLDQFIFYGGYPGATLQISTHDRWANDILNFLYETTISRDILLMTRVNSVRGKNIQLAYWNERNFEVDFVLSRGAKIAAVEVKSGHRPDKLPGLALFAKEHKSVRKWLVGADGIPVEEFLTIQPEELL